ncbi:zinc ribbon domain-containing protein [Blattabacterium cuenoti]|uniref:zinc ribbon domain-containing protein n=1 Tax=Blattabacterium cuenoti TaxID=1653831 RepID=UPI00163BC135|nr:hypothetical protein [Blattabacterium cuenoti]
MKNKEKSIQVQVVDKLRKLYKLQLIDTRIDEIKEFRINIPIEIKIIQDELEKTKKLLENTKNHLHALNEEILQKQKEIKQSDLLIIKYKKQKNNIRNDKELYSLNKEIDYQKLEIQLYHKKIKEITQQINNYKILLEQQEITFKNEKEHIIHKKIELDQIYLENEKEEELLRKQANILSKELDKELLQTYIRIRHGVKNGIAVSPVQRGAPLGSYLLITPQKYSELMQRNKLLIDEHSGRILIDEELAIEERKKYSLLNKKK